jgi:hypothetical protein
MNPVDRSDLDAIATARRLEEMGIAIRSPELVAKASTMNEFIQGGGNRAMRRASKRATRRRGR